MKSEVYAILKDGEGYYTGNVPTFSYKNQPRIYTKLHAAKAAIRIGGKQMEDVIIMAFNLSEKGEVK